MVIFILTFLLLNPLLKSLFKNVEKPIIIIAQDNTSSVCAGKDSTYYKIEYRQKITELIKGLENKYVVKTFSFGEKISEIISWTFSEKETDISQIFDEINIRFANQNVGAVILATDGIYNKGANPVFSSSRLNFPVYTVALGDTSLKRDLVLKKVAYNRVAYLGNHFPLEIAIEAHEFAGENARLKITKGDSTVFFTEVKIDAVNFNFNLPLELAASQKGIQHFTVRLEKLENETNPGNNSFEVYIEVLDGRQKILLLMNAPHPDIKAMRETIDLSDNYETDVFLASDFKIQEIKKYNLVILHELPSLKNPSPGLFNSITQEGLPLIYILGNETDWNQFNKLQTGLNVNASRGKTGECQPTLNKNFSLFTLSPEARNFFSFFPPLQIPLGNYKVTPSAQLLFYQKIGMVETEQPLILFNSTSDKKNAVISGEGIWRWRLSDFLHHKNQNIFNEIFLKTIQYLSLKENKNKFRISGKNNFQENEAVAFDALLYNESMEPVNETDVNFEIINAENKKFPFVFNKTGKGYHLDAGIFPVGDYTYEGHVKLSDKMYSVKGEFNISPLQIEAINTVADHQLLFNLAVKNQGELIYPSQLDSLPEILDKRKDIVSVSYTQKKLSDVINLKWIFFILISFLAIEWFVRKRNGSY